MGKVGSKVKSPSESKKNNTNDFQLLLKNRFYEIANEESVIDKSVFYKYTESAICPQLQSFIYDLLSKPENVIRMERFVQFAEMILGDFDQQAKVLLLFDQPIKQIIEVMISSFFKCEQLDPPSITLLVDFLMEGIPLQLDPSTLSSFMQSQIILPTIIKHISELIFVGPRNSTKLLQQISKNSLLTPAAICLLYANLPEELRDRWKLLFSSEKHGESFMKLVKSVDRAGPCVIVIETTSDRVFGAFASHGFICGPRHTGNVQCFLFEDRQKLHIYSATGYNGNFGYLNSGQVSLPNGIGMGGHGENWSFFLHEDFSSGNSTAGISTFEKCWLAGEITFKMKNIEVWSIGEKYKEMIDTEVQDKLNRQRPLTNKNETRLLLELSGKDFHGDSFKE
ncbi:TLD family protein [Loa loa]|uniref:MTOR-associated protein MEAK7 n=1 Tax=Loa loa TaxID=7209 RepID=A0A1I7W3L1_LOALO|nr:TLD family protein [Loa loa]EFO18227.1 TLD family protein [Loa loa]